VDIGNLDPESFASASFRMYTNEDLWKNCQKQGEYLLRHYFSKSRMLNTLENSLLKSFNERNGLNVDWMQELLWQQQFRATEYMSKYLQAKQTIESTRNV
jgi:hypothetical protein